MVPRLPQSRRLGCTRLSKGAGCNPADIRTRGTPPREPETPSCHSSRRPKQSSGRAHEMPLPSSRRPGQQPQTCYRPFRNIFRKRDERARNSITRMCFLFAERLESPQARRPTFLDRLAAASERKRVGRHVLRNRLPWLGTRCHARAITDRKLWGNARFSLRFRATSGIVSGHKRTRIDSG
jgi:hypothetical protein